MRVVTWNMAHWSHRARHDDAWRWLVEQLHPDIVLFQEAVPPSWLEQTYRLHWSRAYVDSRQGWGTGVASKYELSPERVPAIDDFLSHLPSSAEGKRSITVADGWLATARIKLPALGDVLVSSVHSPSYPIERSRLADVDVSGIKLKKNPDLWFLDVVFHYLRPLLGSQLIVGGDFNASRKLDETLGERGNNEFFDRINDEGFVSLHRLFHADDQRTFFKKGRAEHQLDYLYADAPVARFARSCMVQPESDFSDHAAIVVDFADEPLDR